MKHRFCAAVDSGPSNLEFTLEPLGDDRFVYERGERKFEFVARRLPGRAAWLILRAGRTDICDVHLGPGGAAIEVAEHSLTLQITGRRHQQATPGRSRSAIGPSEIKSPMPGKVVKILVNSGEAVTSGQGVIIVEAMKMENELRATRGGAVASVLVKEGEAVEAGQVMLRID